MSRPAKNISSSNKHFTKEEIEKRKNVEEFLKGKNDELLPNKYLNNRQKEIFFYIIKQLDESKTLGNLDVFVLNQTAICIEKLESIDKIINENFENLTITSFRMIKEMYTKQFFKCCNELCLSPQARAKLSINAGDNRYEKDELEKILSDDDDND